jgi:hypothetical protein
VVEKLVLARDPSGRATGGRGCPPREDARSRVMLVCAALAMAVAFISLTSAVATAAIVHQFSFSFDGAATPDGSLSTPDGVAIDGASGDVFVADVGHNVIDRFDATGRYLSQIDGSGTPAGRFTLGSPASLAVDNSSNPLDTSAGSLYVVDAGAAVVYRFDRTGTYAGQVSGGPFAAGLFGVSVDADGNVWVYDGNATVSEFDFTGSFVTAYNTGFAANRGLAVDSGQHTYPVRGNTSVLKFDVPGTQFASLGTLDTGPAYAVATNLVTDRVFVDHGSSIVAWDSAMAPLESFGSDQVTDTGKGGLAVNSVNDRVYVANPSDNTVYAFDEVLAPDVATDSVSAVTGTGATLNGTVNPLGLSATYQFEYGETSTYGAVAPASPGDAGSGSTPAPVRADVSGLTQGTTYHYRLSATNANGTANTVDATFTTADLPIVDVTAFTSDITSASATLHGTVNPNRADTTYRFEYGTTTSYGASAPVSEADIRAGADPVAIEQVVSGLQPDTTYHYRIVATNVVGTTTGTDHTFTTSTPPARGRSASALPGRGLLPDDRGWELVSPPGKGGADVMGDSARTRAASNGGAVTFSSLGGFGDVHGMGVATEYLSERSTSSAPGDSGWSTHGITPRQDPLSFRGASQALDPLWEGELSADLTSGAFRAWSPLTDAPMAANVQNLYVRHDLRTPGAGSYALATDCTGCLRPLPSTQVTLTRPWLAGASADFSHVLFESVLPLTPDATGDGAFTFNVFEWDNGTLRLVSLVPSPGATSCGSGGPACVSAASAIAGVGASHNLYTPHVVSDDGSRIFFTDTSASPGSQSGALYARIDGSRTVQLNASERTDCADNDPCSGTLEPDPNGPQPATYQTASSDGKRVFFLTNEQLISSDRDGTQDLYMDDEEAGAGAHLSRISVDDRTGNSLDPLGVIGASRDGHWVYYLDSARNMYLWHDGATSRIGRLDDGRDPDINLPTDWNLLVLQSRVTPNGHQLLFASHSGTGLTGRDHREVCGNGFDQGGNPCQALYLYNTDDASMTCVSCDPGGGPVTDNARTNAIALAGGALTTWHLSHPFSDDGKKVFFTTRAGLVPGDSNGKADAYEWEAQGTGGCTRSEGCISLLSSGTDSAESYFMDASANGGDVFFLTRQQLVGWDRDQNYDLYDARVDGGFPEPVPATPPCSADACQGPATRVPAETAAGTAIFEGSGNVRGSLKARKAKCKRGFVREKMRGKVRCVKKRRAHAHRRGRKATRKGGAK